MKWNDDEIQLDEEIYRIYSEIILLIIINFYFINL